MKNETKNSTDFKSMFGQLESTLNLYFKDKAPAMPDSIKEALVKYGPYITAIMMFFALPIVLGLLGLGAMMSPFAYMGGFRYGLGFTFSSLFTVAILVMQAFALPALFKRQKSGWNFMFYVALLQAVENLLRFDLGGLVIGSVISFYILFQIRSYYK